MAEGHSNQLWCPARHRWHRREPLRFDRGRLGEMTVLVVDNLSPFTPDILDCLDRLSLIHIYRRFSDLLDSDLAMCDRVILSGRRKNNKEINAVNSKIIRQCHDSSKPLLGI